MLVKFKITFEDGSTAESHDECYNQIKDHAHFLAPHNLLKWQKYELINDEGGFISVNFNTGIININGQIIHPADGSGVPLTNLNTPQNFKDTDMAWRFLSNLNYFPIVGRRQVKGDWGEAVIYFAGWKIAYRGKTIQRIVYLYPNGQIIFT